MTTKLARIVFDKSFQVFKATQYKEYTFYTNFADLEFGNVVVVQTRESLRLGVFIGYGGDEQLAEKWIVDKVDLTLHQKVLEKEEKIKKLEQKINQRRALFDEISKEELLSAFDPNLKEMLTELQRVVGGEKEEIDVSSKIDILRTKNIL